MTAQAHVTAAFQVLKAAGIDDAMRDARRILAHVLQIDASRVTLALQDTMTDGQVTAFDEFIARRAQREPVSHLTGQRQFYGRTFDVGPDVLDPRPETEELIVAALAVPFGRVLDLGTGSACILNTLLAERGSDTFGIGTDLSAAALAIASRNAGITGTAGRAQFYQGDWFGAVPLGQPSFDLIVSNPPYIAADEMSGLAPEVRDFEPRMALTDEADGLTAYRQISAGAAVNLREGGWLMVEIGPTQGADVMQMFMFNGYESVRAMPDMDGRDRVVVGQKPYNLT
jgi:release factor glutamine methyltransferase